MYKKDSILVDLALHPGVKSSTSTSGSTFYLTPDTAFTHSVENTFPDNLIKFSLYNSNNSPVDVGGTFFVRGESAYSFKLTVPAMETRQVELPKPTAPKFSFSLSTTKTVQISHIFDSLTPASDLFDIYTYPNSQIVASGVEVQTLASKQIQAKRLLNIRIGDFLGPDDYVKLAIQGECLFKFKSINYRTHGIFHFPVPVQDNILYFDIASNKEFLVRPELWKLKISDPAYVAPETSIWRLENTYAN